MNPSMNTRLQTMMRALSESIMPAIRDDAPLAKEQAGLVMAHLSVMLVQGGREARVDRRHHSLIQDLARDLFALCQHETAIEIEARALHEALEAEDVVAMSFAVERLLANPQVSDSFKQDSSAMAISFARAQTDLGRAWFLPMGFDGKPKSLPDVETLLAEGE